MLSPRRRLPLGGHCRHRLHLALVTAFILCLVDATLTPSDRKRGAPDKMPAVTFANGPHELTLDERGLFEEDPKAGSILREHGHYYEKTELKNFKNTVLGYVTPWNNHGYDVAKMFASKFDMVAPVWLQVRRMNMDEYRIEGTHDVDFKWMDTVRRNSNKKAKFIPRLLFDHFADTDFSHLLSNARAQRQIIALIVQACTQHRLDGITLELWSQLAYRVEDPVLIGFVKRIAEALHQERRLFVLVVPPWREHMHDLFSAAHFRQLVDYVDAFSLMTYDYSSVQRPGANAPAKWVEMAVKHICPDEEPRLKLKRSKILIGLNMYGMDYTAEGGGPLMAGKYLEKLRQLGGEGGRERLQWSEEDEESFFELREEDGRHFVFYPTLESIRVRVKLARRLGCGLALWELGQGLDYFYDLF